MLHPTVFRIATLMALASAAIAVAWTSPSAAAVPAAPEVLSAYATPSALGPSGGTVTVTGRVKNARSCQLELLSRQSFPVVYSHNATTACQNGTFSARVLIGGNRSPVKRSVAFALVARDGSLASTGLLYVSLAPLLAPSVLSAYATPSALGPSGGTVTVTGRVKNARSCQLELLSRQSFPVVYSHNATTACQNGTFSARVLIGGNPSPVKRSVAFALVARDGSLASTGLLYVSLAPLLAPSVLSAYATPSALGPSGGTVTVTGRVKNARSCQLELLSRQSFPVVYSHNATTACQNGTFSARVLIGGNPSPVKRSVAFALVASDGSLSSAGLLYVSLPPRPPYLPPPPPPPPLPSQYTPGSTGYDVSWPQCQASGSPLTKSLPNARTFAVVGVNNGTISGFNSCFGAEAAWAGQGLSVYIILQPAPSGGRPAIETSGPKSACAATNQQCAAYDWGYNYAEADLAFVRAQGLQPQIWWLDVETVEGWVTSAAAQPANAAVVQGALDALTAAGKTAGIYCTWYQWGQITGSYTPPARVPIWVAGATSLGNGYYSAMSYCQRALSAGDPSTTASTDIGFAGGIPWLVQYAYTPGPVPVDNDYACG